MILSKENRIEFVKCVKWNLFYKIIGWLSFILIFSKLFPAKDAPYVSWIFIILLIIFVALLLLTRVYLEMIMRRPKKVLTIRDIRLKKLNKLKRKWIFLKH